ncbi:MAG TPA: DUF1573 domain-containing protein [Saprospiraceae bacterium]|jgi:hypothetical protein|nr:DUF1573 domain-containing protein [Saprospiraceae bacterium]
MKNFIIIFASLLISFTGCQQDKKSGNATEGTKTETVNNKNSEGVFMDFTVKDVGAIPRDLPITVQVVITNNKPDSITITKTSTTCDCMDVQIPKKILGPRDTAHMAVTYNARIPGLFEKDVYVTYTGQDSTFKFTLKGHVKQ